MLLKLSMAGLMAVGLAVAQPPSKGGGGPRIGMKGPGGRLNLPGLGMKNGRRPRNAPPREVIDQWSEMSADERQQMVDRLPPDRRDGFRRRMEMWENLKPEERKGVRDRLDRFRDLPTEQQISARRAFRQFSQLPPERRGELRREMDSLRNMSEEERTARFNSDEFRNKFDARERGLVQDLSAALPE